MTNATQHLVPAVSDACLLYQDSFVLVRPDHLILTAPVFRLNCSVHRALRTLLRRSVDPVDLSLGILTSPSSTLYSMHRHGDMKEKRQIQDMMEIKVGVMDAWAPSIPHTHTHNSTMVQDRHRNSHHRRIPYEYSYVYEYIVLCNRRVRSIEYFARYL